jgi:DNA-binding MarR family transcriptional regulator
VDCRNQNNNNNNNNNNNMLNEKQKTALTAVKEAKKAPISVAHHLVLRKLELDGLIVRNAPTPKNPKVTLSLTPAGTAVLKQATKAAAKA